MTISNLGGAAALNLVSGTSTTLQVSGVPVSTNTIAPLVTFISATTNSNALQIGRSVTGSVTIAPLVFNHLSTASAPVIEFLGGFISVTSILGIAATGAGLGFDYVIPVLLNGARRGIPVTSLISLPGPAAF